MKKSISDIAVDVVNRQDYDGFVIGLGAYVTTSEILETYEQINGISFKTNHDINDDHERTTAILDVLEADTRRWVVNRYTNGRTIMWELELKEEFRVENE